MIQQWRGRCRDNSIYALAHALQYFRSWVRLGQHDAAATCSWTDGELVRYRRFVRLSRKRVVRSAARRAGCHPRRARYNAWRRRRARRLWPPNFCAVRSGHVGAAGLFLRPRRRWTHETGQRWRLRRAHEARQRGRHALVVGVVLLHHSLKTSIGSARAPAALSCPRSWRRHVCVSSAAMVTYRGHQPASLSSWC